MEVLAFASFAVLVVGWIVAPTRVATVVPKELDEAA
jgi:hypothetical protein